MECLEKRSRALQRCNLARDIRIRAEASPQSPGGAALPGLFRCQAPCFCPVMPYKTFAHGGAICLAMDRPRDDCGVVVQRPNERMLVQKRQRLLLGRLALQQLADRPQPKAAVRQGDFAGFFQRFAGVLLGQASRPCSTRVPSMPRAVSIASAHCCGLRADAAAPCSSR